MLRAGHRALPHLLSRRLRDSAAAVTPATNTAAFSSSPPQITRKHLLLYDYVADIVNKRAPFREAHIQHASEAKARGHLEQAGAFANPVDGAVFVFRGVDDGGDDAVRAFADADPYVRNGLVTSWTVREWSVVGLD